MRNTRGIFALAALAGAALAAAQGSGLSARPFALMVADKAPAIVTAKWVKGEPVEKFENGKVYVVEFWATWCGPCRISIPHLTELQKKFGDKVTFIGVSAFEADQKKVEPFVQQMGDKMDYRVAMDKVPDGDVRGQNGAMAKNWMIAAGQNGIPTAFIVDRDSKIAWIGHPMEIEATLQKVVDGNWNRDAEAGKMTKSMQEQAEMNSLRKQYATAMKNKDYVTAMAVLDQVIAKSPEMAPRKFDLLAQEGDYTKAYAYGRHLVNGAGKNDAFMLNSLAWSVADPESKFAKKDYDFAIAAAKRAVELTENRNASIMDTLAWAYYGKGNKAKAIETEKTAASLATPQERKDLEASLAKMEGK